MVVRPIPRWLAALDEEKPYVEVIDGERLPDVSPKDLHGMLVAHLRATGPLGRGARRRGRRGALLFRPPGGTWTSLVPDACYFSYARMPHFSSGGEQPRIAPDIVAEVLSPGDRSSITRRKVATFLEYGATVVLVLQPETRRVTVHRADGTSEERDARGTMPLAPYDDLMLDWETIFAKVGRKD
jgi:Uma2 family endonuclease